MKMGRYTAAGFAGLGFLLAVIYTSIRINSMVEGRSPSPVILVEESKHLVTPGMSESSRAMVKREAPGFREHADNGREYSLEDLIREGPVLLTFIKIGCPCSQAAQPFFNQLAAAYPGARVLGVIDGDLGPAKLWISKLRVGYPVLLDPIFKLVRAYGVENSAYVIVIDRDGRIAMHWPGYSAPMLQQLGATLATMSMSPIRPIDTRDAPDELYTGCPYGL